MISSVRGTVAALGPDGAVVEVGGVGLAVSCSPGTLARLRVGEAARLATSLVVREDSLTLYGFADDDERALFELLQTAQQQFSAPVTFSGYDPQTGILFGENGFVNCGSQASDKTIILKNPSSEVATPSRLARASASPPTGRVRCGTPTPGRPATSRSSAATSPKRCTGTRCWCCPTARARCPST